MSISNTTVTTLELAPDTRPIKYHRPAVCGTFLSRLRFGGAHDWLYLQPSNEQLEEIRRLLSFGRGTLGRIGARRADVFDRVCRACLLPENRMDGFIQALRTARGESK